MKRSTRARKRRHKLHAAARRAARGTTGRMRAAAERHARTAGPPGVGVEAAWKRVFGGVHDEHWLPGRRGNVPATPEPRTSTGTLSGAAKRRLRGRLAGPVWCAKGCGTMRRRRGRLACRVCGGTMPEPIA